MQIDWFTVVAQVINFLVLVMLLKRFLYKPVINAMERREQSLLQSKVNAENEAAAAEEKSQLYLQKLQELEQQKQHVLAEAKQNAELERDKLLQQLRLEIADTDQHWRSEVDREKENFLTDARQAMGHELVRLMRKVLVDLANADLQHQVVNLFIHKLRNLSEAEKQKIKAALADVDSTKLKLLSTFDVSSDQKEKLINALNQHVATKLELETQIVPELLCGLVLQLPGGEMQWNMNAYLDGLEEDLRQSLSVPSASR